MAAQVNRPQRKNELGEIATIGGAIAGGVATSGSPAGIMTGAQLGGMAGGMLDKQPAQQGGLAAAQRRMEMPQQPLPQAESPLEAVQKAQLAAQNLPEEIRAEFIPALNAGAAVLRKKGGVA